MTARNKLLAAPPYLVEQTLERLGANLRTARLRRHLTIEDVAEKWRAWSRERGNPLPAYLKCSGHRSLAGRPVAGELGQSDRGNGSPHPFQNVIDRGIGVRRPKSGYRRDREEVGTLEPLVLAAQLQRHTVMFKAGKDTCGQRVVDGRKPNAAEGRIAGFADLQNGKI